MGGARVPGDLLTRALFPFLLSASALFSAPPPGASSATPDPPSFPVRAARIPDPVPAERVVVLPAALRPVAYRLGYADFIAQVEALARRPGANITAADLASLPYPQSAYDRVPFRPIKLAQLRLPRSTLESIGIRMEGWVPRPGDFGGIPVSELRFLSDTAKVLGFLIEYSHLAALVKSLPPNHGLNSLLEQGSATLGDLVQAGIRLDELNDMPLAAIHVSQLHFQPEEALAMGVLPPSAKGVPLTFGDLRRAGLALRQMSGLELDRRELAGLGQAATGKPPIDSGSRKIDGMLLKEFLEEMKESSPAVRKFLVRHDARDTLRIDTLGFAYLFFRNDSVFLQPQAGYGTGYNIVSPSYHTALDELYGPGPAEKMAESGALPAFRLAFGYPDGAFIQAGMAFTRFYGTYIAYQAGFMGYAGILGLTVIESGGLHSPPFFITLGAEYRREWREPDAWNAGPVFQFGVANVGFQAAIRSGHAWGGEAALMVQLFPPADMH